MAGQPVRQVELDGIGLLWDLDYPGFDVFCIVTNGYQIAMPESMHGWFEPFLGVVQESMTSRQLPECEIRMVYEKRLLICHFNETEPHALLRKLMYRLRHLPMEVEEYVRNRSILFHLIQAAGESRHDEQKMLNMVRGLNNAELTTKFTRIGILMPHDQSGEELFMRMSSGDISDMTKQDAEHTEEEEEEEEDEQEQAEVNLLQTFRLTNDHASGGEDHLKFSQDVRAFAALIALRQLSPPLAIALFGPWGTGKSYFMHQLQKQITTLAEYNDLEPGSEAEKNSSPGKPSFCQGIVQIPFNAWSYMDANLWASLVAEIFERLHEYITNSTKGKQEEDAVRQTLNKKLGIIQEERKRLTDEIDRLKADRDTILHQLAELSEQRKKNLDGMIRNKVSYTWRQLGLEQEIQGYSGILRSYGLNPDMITTQTGDHLIRELQSWPLFIRNLFRLNRWQIAVISLAGLFLAGLIIIHPDVINAYLQLPKAILITAITAVAPMAQQLVSTVKKFNRVYKPIRMFKDKFNEQLAKVEAEYEIQKDEIQFQISLTQIQLEQKNADISRLDAQINGLSYEMGSGFSHTVIFNFIRNKEKFYSKHLSLISTIRRDFETLSELFGKIHADAQSTSPSHVSRAEARDFQNNFRDDRKLERIILYIDDLDRCQEDRVIEVLEAVNLLMAFPLFVVVVGVDPRWVKNSLRKKYATQFGQIPHSGEQLMPIDVTDYLEKIFQIPFHLRKAGTDEVRNLVTSMLQPHVREAEVRFTPDDHGEDHTSFPISFQPDTSFQNQLLSSGIGAASREDDPSRRADDREKQEDNESLQNLQALRPDDLILSETEIGNIQELSWLLGNNPRAIKRFANIYRIIRAHESLSLQTESKDRQLRLLAFFIALKTGPYRRISHHIISEPYTMKPLTAIEVGEHEQSAWEILREGLKKEGFDLFIDLDEATIKHLQLVNRFSFE
ncbi:MAG: P-loop NTPase fold protein [Flavobacteriales bacterium]